MVLLARLLSHLVGLLLLILLAAVGLAAAIFCIQGGHGTLSLASLASDIHLPEVRRHVGAFLAHVQAPGVVAIVSLLIALGVVLLGLVLLAGTLVPVRERLLVLDGEEGGSIGARRRALSQAVSTLAERPPQVLRVRARVRPWRSRSGGRVRIRAEHLEGVAENEVEVAVGEAVAPLTEGLALSPRIRARTKRGRAR